VSYSIEWPFAGVASRFTLLWQALLSICFIMVYVVIGAAVFNGYEFANSASSVAAIVAYEAQGFTASQAAYLQPYYAFETTNHWQFPYAMRYSMEVITSIGYGVYTPQTSGGRTFAILYIFFGLGIVVLQLETLARAASALPLFVAEHLVRCFRPEWHSPWSRDTEVMGTLEFILDNFQELIRGPDADSKTLEDVRAAVVGMHVMVSSETLDEVLADLDCDGDHRIEGHVASIQLAHTYSRVTLRQKTRSLIISLFLYLSWILMSIGIFTATEDWSVGDAAWFVYITCTTIGLGDFTATSTAGFSYWFICVLGTLGLLGEVIPCAAYVFVYWRQRVTAWWLA